MEKGVFIITTCPSEEAGEVLARKLLEKRLAACVNIIPRVRSLYWWKGEIQDDGEVYLFVKTRENLKREVMSFIAREHSYEVPEIIELVVGDMHPPYLQWIVQETSRE